MKTRVMPALVASVLWLIVWLLWGCSPKAAPAPAPVAAPPQAPALSSSEQEWQKVLQAARKEGRVNFYATFAIPEVRAALNKAMSEKYGVKIEWLVSTGPVNAERIRVEHLSRQYVADLWWSGASVTNITLLRSVGALDAFRPPIVDGEPQAWRINVNSLDGTWDNITMFLTLSQAMVVNTVQVRPEDYPRSFRDLLAPQWKGKIVMQDPTISGSGSWLMQSLKEQYGSLEYFEKLATQNVAIIRDFSEIARRVAVGESSVVLSLSPAFLMPYLVAGAPVKIVATQEGATRSHNIIDVISKSPHPNAARVLVNYMLTKEAQESVPSLLGVLPIRKDAKYTFHPAVQTWVEETKKWRDIDWQFMVEIDKDLQAGVARRIFGIR